MRSHPIILNKAMVRKHFDRHAHEYDGYAVIQTAMAEQLLARLAEQYPDITFTNILEIGCGTGILTKRLLQKYPAAQMTAVDLSPTMIAQTKAKVATLETAAGVGAQTGAEAERARSVSRIRYITADAEELHLIKLHPAKRFDLIISNAAFQWFNEPRQTIHGYVSDFLQAAGVLAFTTFGPDTFHELHSSFRLAEDRLGLSHRTHGSAFGDRIYWESMFNECAAAGRFVWHQQTQPLYFSSVRDFLYSVKRIGAGNAAVSAKGISTRRLFAEMETIYTQNYSSDAGIQATYDMVFGLFSKK